MVFNSSEGASVDDIVLILSKGGGGKYVMKGGGVDQIADSNDGIDS